MYSLARFALTSTIPLGFVVSCREAACCINCGLVGHLCPGISVGAAIFYAQNGLNVLGFHLLHVHSDFQHT